MSRIVLFLCLMLVSTYLSAHDVDSSRVSAGKYTFITVRADHSGEWPVMFSFIKPEDMQIVIDTSNFELFVNSIFERAYYVPELALNYESIYKSVYGESDYFKINSFVAEFVGRTRDCSQTALLQLSDGWTISFTYTNLTGFFYFPNNDSRDFLDSNNEAYLKDIDNLKCCIPVCIQFYDEELNKCCDYKKTPYPFNTE